MVTLIRNQRQTKCEIARIIQSALVYDRDAHYTLPLLWYHVQYRSQLYIDLVDFQSVSNEMTRVMPDNIHILLKEKHHQRCSIPTPLDDIVRIELSGAMSRWNGNAIEFIRHIMQKYKLPKTVRYSAAKSVRKLCKSGDAHETLILK
jgi:hypothetical protein